MSDKPKGLPELEDGMPTHWGEAVKGLKKFLLEELKLEDAHVSVRGDFAMGLQAPVVRIACIEFTDKSLRGGFDFSASGNANTLGLLSAAGRFVETFHTQPFTPPGWTSQIDDHGQARFQLSKLLGQPDPDAMLRVIARVSELAGKHPAMGMMFAFSTYSLYEGASCPLKEVMATLLKKKE
jgi:hypothetical protein